MKYGTKIIYGILIVAVIIACKSKIICATVAGPLKFTFVTPDSTDAFKSGSYSIDSLKLFLYRNGTLNLISHNADTITRNGKSVYVISTLNIYNNSLAANTTSTFLVQLKSTRIDTLSIHCNNIISSACTGPSGDFDVPKYNGRMLEFENSLHTYIVRL